MTSDRLEFTRTSERRTSDDKLLRQLKFIAERALSGSRGKGWLYEVGTIEADQKWTFDWEFTSWIKLWRRIPAATDPVSAQVREQSQRSEIYQFASAAGHHQKFGNHPWVAKLPKEERLLSAVIQEIVETSESKEQNKEQKEQSDLIEDIEPTLLSSISRIQPNGHYDHLYGVEAQVRLLLSSIQAAADSEMRNRFHTLLHGDPGAGKTDILLSTHRLLSDLNISCLSIDATSTTEAGMRKLLLDEDEILPEVILVEEIEKARHSFHLLLGIMDERGTVSQMNFRKTASRKVPALVLASANDYGALEKTDSGALLSRFANQIYCPRPTREIAYKILEREISKVKNGDLAWIEPTLKFGFDQRGITDPRQLKRICLCGKERLISGEYQRDLEETMYRRERTTAINVRRTNEINVEDL